VGENQELYPCKCYFSQEGMGIVLAGMGIVLAGMGIVLAG